MGKREVPTLCRKVMDVDVWMTNKFCSICEKFMSFRSLKTHYKVLELSCHGIPWLAGWLAFIFLTGRPSLYQMQVNLYIGLLLDLVIVGLLKALVRRRRPANNGSMAMTYGPDIYSFPSGHATRSVYLAYFFSRLWPLPFYIQPALFVWASSVSISRVLLKRHHLLDVIVGAFVGIFEGLLISFIWLGQDASEYFISFITDEATSGGEYHV